ncbi:hypothetical protein HPB49_009356 [Dermacentor silvarum]|uniref:Uncharacterized protein n=1 Tax=Dermacentor silvarum TaxID=543639 RepID=A0ACB8DY13_DERSI|nr:transcription factor sox-3 [Dermacentor silvarum]KAH7979412.1 hypothetical protein HPB49_009356 [Dermacentor silvarum]
MAVPVEASDPGLGGPSMSSDVQHSYQLRSRIPRPPNAFMLFAQEERRSVAAENPNENNQCVRSRLGKLCRNLSTANKEPYQRKVVEAANVHRRNHPDYVYNPREAYRCKGHDRRTKAIASKPKRRSSGDQEQQPSISTAVAQDRRNATPYRLTAIVTATASARSDAWPYNGHRFPGPLPLSLRVANREYAAPTAQLAAARAFKQPKTPCAPTMLDNQLSPTLLDDEDDDSSVGTSSFDQGRFPETLGSADGAPGDGQPS